jgi:iron complex outermembrane receptor protein
VEAWGVWQPVPPWRLQAGVTRLWQDLHVKPGSSNSPAAVAAVEGVNPARQVLLRSSLELPRGVEVDLTARHVSALAAPAVPGYTAVDLRLGWQPRPELELSLGVQNLFDRGHAEFGGIDTRSELGRAVVLRLVYRH